MTFYTHVNKHRIRSNEPAITIKRGKSGKPTYARRVRLPAGAEIIHDPDNPILPCGARLVIVSSEMPEVLA